MVTGQEMQRAAKHMRDSASPAAKVRRDFMSGRPPGRSETFVPLHPVVVLEKADAMLSDLRARMTDAGLEARDVHGFIVCLVEADPLRPKLLAIGHEYAHEAFDVLTKRGVYAVGVAFYQADKQAGKDAYFVRQFTAMPDGHLAVLRIGAAQQLKDAINQLKANA